MTTKKPKVSGHATQNLHLDIFIVVMRLSRAMRQYVKGQNSVGYYGSNVFPLKTVLYLNQLFLLALPTNLNKLYALLANSTN